MAGRNRPFRALLLCFVVQSAGVATILAGVQYFADQVLRDSHDRAHPAVRLLRRRRPCWSCRCGPGSAPGWASSPALVAASLILAAGGAGPGRRAGAARAAVIYLLVALIGVGYAGQQVFALAMLPDCIAYDTARTGRRQAGVFTGLWTAGETFGLALGPGIYGLVLQLSGYVSSTTGTAAVQSDTARLGVLLGFTVLPALLVALATLLLRPYDLTEARLATLPTAADHGVVVGTKGANQHEKGTTSP